MAKYKHGPNNLIINTETGAFVPSDLGNRDYQEYLDWPNKKTTEPADVVDPWEEGRSIRDRRISATDWTQLADVQLSAQQVADYANYRQALRDLPLTFPDFNDVVWPVEPN